MHSANLICQHVVTKYILLFIHITQQLHILQTVMPLLHYMTIIYYQICFANCHSSHQFKHRVFLLEFLLNGLVQQANNFSCCGAIHQNILILTIQSV